MSSIQKKIESSRKDYSISYLDETAIDKNPLLQFEKWMEEAIANKTEEPNAMTLSTVDENGRVSSRIVLLRNFNENGFSFFTNYNSKKASELGNGKFCALNFFWQQIQRQVRIEGEVYKLSAKESDNYFNSRPRESQVGAHASAQSTILKNRKELEDKFAMLLKEFEGKEVPRPQNWGGFIIKPLLYEFWQGRPNRLHDRIQYTLTNNQWFIDRLSP